MIDVCRSIEKFCTCPRRKLAGGVPGWATPGWWLRMGLNVNEPVGDGGWTTFRRSHRQSSPAFTAWRPLSHVNASAISDTLVLKFDAVLGGDPSCWYPAIRNVGSVLGNCAVDGMPGMPSASPAADGSSAAVRPTVRRVSPARASLSRLDEKVWLEFDAKAPAVGWCGPSGPLLTPPPPRRGATGTKPSRKYDRRPKIESRFAPNL